MSAPRVQLSYANVMSTIAVFLALGGGAVAASGVLITSSRQVAPGAINSSDLENGKAVRIADLTPGARRALRARRGPAGPAGPPGTDAGFRGAAAGGDLTGTYPDPSIGAGKVTSASIFDGTIGGLDLAPDAVTGAKVAPDSLTGADVDEATLGQVPDAGSVDGIDSTALVRGNARLDIASLTIGSVPDGTLQQNLFWYQGQGFRLGAACFNNVFGATGARVSLRNTGMLPLWLWRDGAATTDPPSFAVLDPALLNQSPLAITDVVRWHGNSPASRFTVQAYTVYGAGTCLFEAEILTYD